MKKYLLVILLVIAVCIGCSKKEEIEKGSVTERSIDYLMNQYIDGYMKEDYEKVQSVMPEFVIITNPYQYSKEGITEVVSSYKEQCGNDYTINYDALEINKLDSVQSDKLNDLIENAFHTNEKVFECSSLSGNLIISGAQNTLEEDFSAYYCKYNNNWYLLIN